MRTIIGSLNQSIAENMHAATVQINRDLLVYWYSHYHCLGRAISHNQDGQQKTRRLVLWGVLILLAPIQRSPQEFVSQDMPKAQAKTETYFNIWFSGRGQWDVLPYKRLVNYTFLVCNENTLRYVYAKLKEKLQICFWIK